MWFHDFSFSSGCFSRTCLLCPHPTSSPATFLASTSFFHNGSSQGEGVSATPLQFARTAVYWLAGLLHQGYIPACPRKKNDNFESNKTTHLPSSTKIESLPPRVYVDSCGIARSVRKLSSRMVPGSPCSLPASRPRPAMLCCSCAALPDRVCAAAGLASKAQQASLVQE